MKILIGSNNIGKIKEYKDLLGPGFDLISLHELGIELDVEETGKTYAENALIKLNAIKDKSDIPILTDDSGLEVRALGDRPGIFSARYSGKNATDESNVDKLIKE
ncbi:non-canonical purine NTP pyrophosphatase, partial [bacterium]|nr:non-canonical purine NTP pyrophosphatase [bacterium]